PSDTYWGVKISEESSIGLFKSRQPSLMEDGNAICFNYYRHFPHSVVGLHRRTAISCARYHLLAGGRSIARSLEWSASPKWSLRRRSEKNPLRQQDFAPGRKNNRN